MNIYEKLQNARVELAELNITKTGKNTFAKYDYFELEDFLPLTMRIFSHYKLCGTTSFFDNRAVLTIINSENPEEKIHFESLTGDADLKGCHSIQNQGAVMTYQRRYLYFLAMEITEPETLDRTNEKNKNDETNKNNKTQPETKTPPKTIPATDKDKNGMEILKLMQAEFENNSVQIKDFAKFAGFDSSVKNKHERISELLGDLDKLNQLFKNFKGE